MRRAGQVITCLAVLLALALLAGCGGSSGSSHSISGSTSTTAAGWSTLNLTKTLHGSGANVVDISCTTGPFCMILAANGTYTSWKTVPYRHGKVGTPSTLTAGPGAVLSCASSTDCVSYSPSDGGAGDGSQSYSVWNGSRWTFHSLAFSGAPSGASLTCPSRRLCLAIGNNGTQGTATLLTFTPQSVSDGPFPNHGQTLSSITCASATYCYVISTEGDVWKLTGLTHLAGPTPLTVSDAASHADPVNQVACASGPYCVGVGTGGGVVSDTGSGFHTVSGLTLAGGNGLATFAHSCASAHFCLVQSPGSHRYAVLDGTQLSTIASQPAGLPLDLSCTTARLCMADLGTPSAKVLIYQGG
jgi:hypothetical protein